MQHVYTARDEMDAHFVKGLLEQEGIEAAVTGSMLEATWSTLPLSDQSLPAVWVKESDESRAQEIVAEYVKKDSANASDEDVARPTWKCPNCGEAVEQQFTECWNCGQSRPEAAAVADPDDGPH